MASLVVARGLSICGSQALEHRLNCTGLVAPRHVRSSCTRPAHGIKPMSPALTGRFFTSEPSGKSFLQVLNPSFYSPTLSPSLGYIRRAVGKKGGFHNEHDERTSEKRRIPLSKQVLTCVRAILNRMTPNKRRLLQEVKLVFFSLVQSSHTVLSDSLRPHGLKHARPLCPSTTPRVNSNSCPLSW